MKVIEFMGGTSVEEAAAELIRKAPAKGMFNGVYLACNDRSQGSASVISAWRKEMDAKSEAYKKSPEYKEQQLKRKIKAEKNQLLIDGMMSRLNHSKANPIATLKWLAEFSQVADDNRMKYSKSALIKHLVSMRVSPNMNTGDAYDSSDINNRVHYVLGQALDNLMNDMPPHPICKKFADEILADLK